MFKFTTKSTNPSSTRKKKSSTASAASSIASRRPPKSNRTESAMPTTSRSNSNNGSRSDPETRAHSAHRIDTRSSVRPSDRRGRSLTEVAGRISGHDEEWEDRDERVSRSDRAGEVEDVKNIGVRKEGVREWSPYPGRGERKERVGGADEGSVKGKKREGGGGSLRSDRQSVDSRMSLMNRGGVSPARGQDDGQDLADYSRETRDVEYGKPGSAADYYNDQSQSVHPQAGNRPESASVAASAGVNSTFYGASYQTPSTNTDMATQHTHTGPISKLVDWWKDHEDVRKMEEYTEYIGVCKHCFDPRSSPADAPRKHHYYRRISNESLRRRSSESLRRIGARDSNHGRIDKDSRYHSSDHVHRRKKSSWLGDGVASAVGYGLARLWEGSRNFDDTYSVQSGRRSETSRQSSHPSSVERGILYGNKYSKSISVRTGDKRPDKEKSRSRRSRLGSRDRTSTMLGTAAIAGLSGSGALLPRKTQSAERSSHTSFARSHTSGRDQSQRAVLIRRRQPRGRSESSSLRDGNALSFASRQARTRLQPSVGTSYSSRNSDRGRATGMFGGILTVQPEPRRREHRKKSGRFFTFTNQSSSFADSDLAFGSLPFKPSYPSKKSSWKIYEERFKTTLLGIEATAAAIGAAKRRNKPSQRPLSTAKNNKSARGRQKSRNLSSADNDWESASEYDKSDSVDSDLAFGDFNFGNKQKRRQPSPASVTSQSSGSNKWSWRWGSKKQKSATPIALPQSSDVRKHDGSRDSSYAGVSSGRASSRGDASASGISSPSSMPPMRYVHPVSTHDPTVFDAIGSMFSGSHSQRSSAMSSKPESSQIQNVQPVSSLRSSLAALETKHQASEAPETSIAHSRPDPFRRARSGPVIATVAEDAIVTAGTAVATAEILANDKNKSSKDDSSAGVRFELSEKQAKKDMRERRKEKLRDDEKSREDEDRAMREEAAPHIAENELHKLHERGDEADRHRLAEEFIRVEDERREEREAAEARAWIQSQREIEAKQREIEYRHREMADVEAALPEDEQRRADESDRQRREDLERWRRAEVQREMLGRDDPRPSFLPDREGSGFHGYWSVPSGTGVTGAVISAELAYRRHEQDSRSGSARYVMSAPPDKTARDSRPDNRVYGNESPEQQHDPNDDRRKSGVVLRATEQVLSDMAHREERPAPSHATFPSPASLAYCPKGKEAVRNAIEDNDVRDYFVMADGQNNSDDVPSLPHQPPPRRDTSCDGSRETPSWSVPTLNFIAPTPPVSVSGSARRNRSPVASTFRAGTNAPEQDQARSSAERERYGSISWGHDQPQEYEPRIAESTTHGFNTHDPHESRAFSHEESLRQSSHPRLYEDSAITNPNYGNIERAHDDYKVPYYESVTDLAFRPSSPGSQAVHGFVEGEADEPTPVSEEMPHVPSGFDVDAAEDAVRDAEVESAMTPKEKKRRDQAAKRAERDQSSVTSQRQDDIEQSKNLEAPPSKKEKKRGAQQKIQGLHDSIETSNAFKESGPAVPDTQPSTMSVTKGPNTSAPSIAYDNQDGWSNVKTKKSKRASDQFNSQAAASPLRSEVVWGVHMPYDDGRPELKDEWDETSNAGKQSLTGPRSRSRAMSESAELPKRTQFSPPDLDRDARSVNFSPVEGFEHHSAHRRKPRHNDENEDGSSRRSRSVAASAPREVHEDSKRMSTRDRSEFDDATSIVSVRSSRSAMNAGDDRSTTSRKEKSGGLLSLLGLRSTENTPKSKRIGRDDKLAGEKKQRSRRNSDGDVKPRSFSRSRPIEKSRHSSTARHRTRPHEADEIEDSQSQTSERHRRRSHRYKDDSDDEGRDHAEDDPQDALASTSESRRKQREREKALERDGDDYTLREAETPDQHEREESFLEQRVEDEEFPPLPTSAPPSPIFSLEPEQSKFASPSPLVPILEHPEATLPDFTISPGNVPFLEDYHATTSHTDTLTDDVQLRPADQLDFSVALDDETELLPLITSPPSSPAVSVYTPRRPLIPLRPASSTSIPLRFRRPPISPLEQRERSSSFSYSSFRAPGSPVAPRSRQKRPHSSEFKYSTEFRPLYLVESNSRPQNIEGEEGLPSLPSTRTASRSSSYRDDEMQGNANDNMQSGRDDEGGLEGPREHREDVLDSQQTTPKASRFAHDVLDFRTREQPEFYSWSDVEREGLMHEISEQERLEVSDESVTDRRPRDAVTDAPEARPIDVGSQDESLIDEDTLSETRPPDREIAMHGADAPLSGEPLTAQGLAINNHAIASDKWAEADEQIQSAQPPEPCPPIHHDASGDISPSMGLSHTLSNRKGKKAQKSREQKLGTAWISEPVIGPSVEELADRRRQNAEVMVEGRFDDEPADRGPQSHDDDLERHDEAKDVTLPGPLSESSIISRDVTQNEARHQSRATADTMEGIPDAVEAGIAPEPGPAMPSVLLARKKSKRDKKKQKKSPTVSAIEARLGVQHGRNIVGEYSIIHELHATLVAEIDAASVPLPIDEEETYNGTSPEADNGHDPHPQTTLSCPEGTSGEDVSKKDTADSSVEGEPELEKNSGGTAQVPGNDEDHNTEDLESARARMLEEMINSHDAAVACSFLGGDVDMIPDLHTTEQMTPLENPVAGISMPEMEDPTTPQDEKEPGGDQGLPMDVYTTPSEIVHEVLPEATVDPTSAQKFHKDHGLRLNESSPDISPVIAATSPLQSETVRLESLAEQLHPPTLPDEETATTTPTAIENVPSQRKLSKKDKKKGKASRFAGTSASKIQKKMDAPVEDSSPEHVMSSEVELGTSGHEIMAGNEESEWSLPVKISKKDKKKGKKAKTWEEDPAGHEPNTALENSTADLEEFTNSRTQQRQEKIAFRTMGNFETMPELLSSVLPEEPDLDSAAPATDIIAETNLTSEGTFEKQDVIKKASKKDKKKANMAKAQDLWASEDQTPAPTYEDPSGSASGQDLHLGNDVPHPGSEPQVKWPEPSDVILDQHSLNDIQPELEWSLPRKASKKAMKRAKKAREAPSSVALLLARTHEESELMADEEKLALDVPSAVADTADVGKLGRAHAVAVLEDDTVEMSASQESEKIHEYRDDDFTVILAAGLRASGFDPAIVTEDLQYHRQEFPSQTEETESGGASSQAVAVNPRQTEQVIDDSKMSAVEGSIAEESSHGHTKIPADDFLSALTAGLAASGFAPDVLTDRELDDVAPYAEEGQASFAVSNRKKQDHNLLNEGYDEEHMGAADDTIHSMIMSDDRDTCKSDGSSDVHRAMAAANDTVVTLYSDSSISKQPEGVDLKVQPKPHASGVNEASRVANASWSSGSLHEPPKLSETMSLHERSYEHDHSSDGDPLQVSIEINPHWSGPAHSDHDRDQSRNQSESRSRDEIEEGELGFEIDSTTKDRTSYLFQSPPDTGDNAIIPENGSLGTPLNSQQLDSVVIERAQSEGPSTLIMPGNSEQDVMHRVPHESPILKKHRSITDVGTPEQGVKVPRRSQTPSQGLGEDPFTFTEILRSASTNSRAGGSGARVFWHALNERHSDRDLRSRRGVEDLRSVSGRSDTSVKSASRLLKTSSQDFRSVSLHSHESFTSVPDHNESGDLRATGSGGATPGPTTIAFEPPPTPPLQEDDQDTRFNGLGSTRATAMTDVYAGWGDVHGQSSFSPTRPPSVRKRQSMHIVDLEAQLHRLQAEYERLQIAKANLEFAYRDAPAQADAADQLLKELLQARDAEIAERNGQIQELRAMLESSRHEVTRSTEANDNLHDGINVISANKENRIAALQAEHSRALQQCEQSNKELNDLRNQHAQLSESMEVTIRQEIARSLVDKNKEVSSLEDNLNMAHEQIRLLRAQIVDSKSEDWLSYRDEDYFDTACQKLCQHVQQWILRFSKYADNRMCRLTSDVADEKIEARLDNAILDGTDVDKLLADRVRRRDIFMSIVMSMIWEYIFTRYLFGMDREQRQKLKALEKILADVGPQRAVAQWRATTLTLLSHRPAFATQRNLDTEAVAQEILSVLSMLLPPPAHLETQILASLRNVLRLAVDLSIEMRTQRAEYIMLPPLQPEWNANGELVRKVHFNSALMNVRSGDYSPNEDFQAQEAVVKIVLFPLVVKKGDDAGVGEHEIVVCPAQVLVAEAREGKKVVRVLSEVMDIDEEVGGKNRSRQSLVSAVDSSAF